jgi:hypothetical protein
MRAASLGAARGRTVQLRLLGRPFKAQFGLRERG